MSTQEKNGSKYDKTALWSTVDPLNIWEHSTDYDISAYYCIYQARSQYYPIVFDVSIHERDDPNKIIVCCYEIYQPLSPMLLTHELINIFKIQQWSRKSN